MGRLGPLTSQALGRSPYDDVVQGTGEIDPSAPLQLYDERGRPVNHETKKINKDIIRSHNEVMQVIGVAEPDHPVVDPQVEKQRQQNEDEDQIGRRLTTLGRTLGVVGVWGVNGLRLRNLLFREYSTVRFFELYRYQRQHTSFSDLFLAGLPSFVVSHAIKLYQHHHQPWPRRPMWTTVGLDYIHLHLQAYIMMQRVGLIPARQWFPHPGFFIPFTSHSPVPPLPPLSDVSISGIGQWVGTVAMNIAPALAFAGFQKLWVFVMRGIWLKLYDQLPSPSPRAVTRSRPRRAVTPAEPPPSPPQPSPPQDSSNQLQLASPSEQPQPAAAENQAQPSSPTQPRNGRDIARDDPTARLLESHPEADQHIAEPQTPQPALPPPPPDHPALGAVRRQSTFSTRGDEYVSEDEDTEIVNATLISFDVEATESADVPPGVWSAELRPSNGPATNSGGNAPRMYADNALTRLPLVIATDVLTLAASYVVVAPYEAFALRYFVGAVRGRMGLGMADIGPLRIWESISWVSVTTFLGIEFLHLAIDMDYWSVMWALAQLYRGCKPEWSFWQVVNHNIDQLDPLDGLN